MPLVGCTTEHQCGPLKTVEPGHTLSPWVRCVFRGGGGNEITVGNDSCPSLDNSAVIKSFNFGISDGGECKVVIHDMMGSSLRVFLKNMMKELQGEKDYFMIAQWGWTKAGCPTPPPSSISKKHYLQVRWVETNFVQGKFIHEITAVDTMNLAVEGGIEDIYGEDSKNAITLKAALQKLFTEKPHPIVKSVKYCRLNKETGNPECNVGFKIAPDGPKHCWRGNSANKLEIARSWVSGWVTDQDKIFVPVYETNTDGGEVIFWERPVFDCDEVTNQALCIGTYIVNGGEDSPVIEFNPRIKWQFGQIPANGGNMADGTIEDQPKNKAEGVKKCKEQSRAGERGTGQVLSIPPTNVHKDIEAKRATSVKGDAQAKQAVQDSITYMDSGIMADMTIVGDPTLPTQSQGVIQGKTVAIAFVNPFHILPASNMCGDWLAKPPCNEVLSNKNWLIMKLNHRIEGGTYTTTFQLRCVSPGLDAAVSNPIGNSPDGTTI